MMNRVNPEPIAQEKQGTVERHRTTMQSVAKALTKQSTPAIKDYFVKIMPRAMERGKFTSKIVKERGGTTKGRSG